MDESYATIADYELRTGIDVPEDKEPMIQQRMDDISQVVALYLGPCATMIAEAYPDVLAGLVVNHLSRVMSVPEGIRSETVGATSVSYTDQYIPGQLVATETSILDALLQGTPCARTLGLSEVEASWGGSW